MRKLRTTLPGVYILEPEVYADARGWFMETWSARAIRELELPTRWVQDNASKSSFGVLRGLHYQRLRPQAKLVWVAQGKAWDVVVDIRRGSPNFGDYVGVELTGENRRMVYIPRGMAHGFVSLAMETVFLYKCDADYSGSDDQCGVRWDDADLGIPWPVKEPVLSEKDKVLPRLTDIRDGMLPKFRPE